MTCRAIFMGTPDFAVPTLEVLVELGFDVLVVTQPDKKVGRKREWTAPPVKAAAKRQGLSVLQPEKIRDSEALSTLFSFQPDILVTAAYGQLLPKSLLDLPTKGAVNIHASLLPRWRGAAPIHRAILAGDRETGVTLMEMVPALDAGPMIASRSLIILDTDDVGTLHDKLANLGAELARDVLPRYLAGEVKATAQPEDGVTYAAKIERADEFVNWNRASIAVSRHIRGLSPWPGASTKLGDGLSLKVWSAVTAGAPFAFQPGEVKKVGNDILVGAQDGVLALGIVQPSGRRRMQATDWFSGLHQSSVQFLSDALADGV